jgi:hypothetical protein
MNMGAASVEQDFLCRAFGNCIVGEQIDREVGDMIGKKGPVTPKLFTYGRFNADLSRAGLNALGLPNIEPGNVQKMDSVDHIGDLQRVGRAVAEQKVVPNFDMVFGKFLP